MLFFCFFFSKPSKWSVQQAAIFQHLTVRHKGDNSRQLMCLSLLIADHFGESTSGGPARRHPVKGQAMCLSCWWHGIDITRTNYWFQTSLVDEWLGVCGGAMWQGESEREPSLPPNPSYWVFGVGSHHSLPLCYLWLQNFNKSTPASHTQKHCLLLAHLWSPNEDFFLAEAFIFFCWMLQNNQSINCF